MIRRGLSFLFYILFLSSILWVMSVLIIQPMNNLIPGQMLVLELIFFAVILGGCILWRILYPRLERYEKWIYRGLLLFLGILLFLATYRKAAMANATLIDYLFMYQTSRDFAAGIPFDAGYPTYAYLLEHQNNVIPMVMLGWLFRLGNSLKISGPVLTSILVSLQVVFTVWGIGYLVGWEKIEKEPGDGEASGNQSLIWRIPTALLFFGFLPIWGYSTTFYTDTMSMGLSVIAMALLKLAYMETVSIKENVQALRDESSQNRKYQTKAKYLKQILLTLLAAFFILMMYYWKMTGIISFVGMAIAFVVLDKHLLEKNKLKTAALFTCSLLFLYLLFQGIFHSYDFYEESLTRRDPFTSWLVIGLGGDGSYFDNSWFPDELHKMENYEAKQNLVNDYLKEHWREAFDKNHLFSKVRRNFADGNLDMWEFVPAADDGTAYWQLFSPWGRYYWRVSQWNTCYLFWMLGMLMLGGIWNLMALLRGKEFSVVAMGSHIAFVGAFFFLMAFEANSRQLYNQLPFLMVGMMLAMDGLTRAVLKK